MLAYSPSRCLPPCKVVGFLHIRILQELLGIISQPIVYSCLLNSAMAQGGRYVANRAGLRVVTLPYRQCHIPKSNPNAARILAAPQRLGRLATPPQTQKHSFSHSDDTFKPQSRPASNPPSRPLRRPLARRCWAWSLGPEQPCQLALSYPTPIVARCSLPLSAVRCPLSAMMDDYVSESDSDYTSYWRDWVSNARS